MFDLGIKIISSSHEQTKPKLVKRRTVMIVFNIWGRLESEREREREKEMEFIGKILGSLPLP